jgi:hypothetical protein
VAHQIPTVTLVVLPSRLITTLEDKQMPNGSTNVELQNLAAAVAQDQTVAGSAITLLAGLSASLNAAIAAGTVQPFADALNAQTAALQAAIVANTPAASAPAPAAAAAAAAAAAGTAAVA